MENPYLIIAVAFLLPTLCAGQVNNTQCENGTITKNEADCQILSLINARRSSLTTGSQYNGVMAQIYSGSNPELLPPAKDLRKLTWSCDLEKEASTLLEGLQCDMHYNPDDEPPSLAHGYAFTGDYYAVGDPGPDISELLWHELAKIDNTALSKVTESAVSYSDDDGPAESVPKEYANLMRNTVTQVGCAKYVCELDGYKYFKLLCYTDQADIKTGDTIYEVSSTKSCECTPPLVCDGGLCVEPVTTTQTPTVTTSAAVTNGTNTPAADTTIPAPLAVYPGSSAADPSTWCNWTELPDTMRMHMQDTHNFRRSTLALGQVTDNTGATLPAATNMNYLKWNCTLEREAHDFLANCPTEGYQRPDGNSPAQNFYRGTITGNEPTFRDMNKKTVTEWWKPVRKVAGPGQSAYFTNAHSSSSIKTYTLMGWARSHQMGCSIAKCGNDWVEACRYYPPGNEVGGQQYKPGKACSDCNSLGTGPCSASLGLCGSDK